MSDETSDLEDALDGLIDASNYAEDIGEFELSRDIARLYQELAKASPNEHWDTIYTYRVEFNSDADDGLESNLHPEHYFFVEEISSDVLELMATEDQAGAIADLSVVEAVNKQDDT